MKLVGRLVIAVFGLVFIGVVAVSWIAERVLEDQLLANGAERVEIDKVYLNPFTGYVSLTDVKVFALGRRSFAVKELKVNVAWLDLMQRQIRFTDIFISGLDLAVWRSETNLLVGVPKVIPSPSPSSSPSLSPSPSPSPSSQSALFNWHWAVDQLRVEDSLLSYKDVANEFELALTKFGLRDVQTWNRESPGHVSANAVLKVVRSGTAPISFDIDSVGLDSDVGIFIDPSFGLMWHGDGALKFNAVALELDTPQVKVEQRSLDVLFSLSGWPLKSGAVEGLLDINAQQLTVDHLDHSILEVMAAQISRLRVSSLASIKWDGLRFEEIEVAALNQGEKPLLLLRQLDVTNGSLSELKRLRIENVTVDGMDVQLTRNPQGQLELPQFELTSREQSDPAQDSSSSEVAKEVETDEESRSEEKQPFSWQLVEFQLMDNSQVTFVDQSVNPSVTQVISALGAHGKNIGSNGLVEGPNLQAQGKLNQFGEFKLLAEPSDSPGTIQMTAQVKAVELPEYSPYLRGVYGYQFKSGQLFLDVQAMSEGKELVGNVDVRLNNVYLQPYDQELIKSVSKQLAMPLDVALNTLRNKNGDVVIDIPVQGPLSQPAFSFNDVMRQVTLRALKMATLSMIKHAIQPYGTAITAAQMLTKAGKRITTIKVQDIKFPNDDHHLDEQAKLQLDKLSELLTNKKELRLNICAFTTEQEVAALVKASVDPNASPDLALALASNRSKAVKLYLGQQQGIAEERLYLCQSQVDTKNDATPRVELSL